MGSNFCKGHKKNERPFFQNPKHLQERRGSDGFSSAPGLELDSELEFALQRLFCDESISNPEISQLSRTNWNYDWVLDEAGNHSVGLSSPLPAGGTTGQQQPQVKAKDKIDKGTQTEGENDLLDLIRMAGSLKENKTETTKDMGTPWSPAELTDMLKNAPDPFTKPIDFKKWLRQACTVYKPRPVLMERLLELVYQSKWDEVREKFSVPGSDRDADWSGPNAMIKWLDGDCKASIISVAQRSPNFERGGCRQRPNESVRDFVSRFDQWWNSTQDETYGPSTTFILSYSLQSQVAKLLKLKVINWMSCTFPAVKCMLETMEDQGMFESKQKTEDLIRKHWDDLEDSSSEDLELPQYNPPRRIRRRGRCYSCGRYGHWARECWTNLQQLQQFVLE